MPAEPAALAKRFLTRRFRASSYPPSPMSIEVVEHDDVVRAEMIRAGVPVDKVEVAVETAA